MCVSVCTSLTPVCPSAAFVFTIIITYYYYDLVWVLQDAAPAAVHAHERRAVPEERRHGAHDDATDRGRVTGNAGPQAVEAAAEAAAASQVPPHSWH